MGKSKVFGIKSRRERALNYLMIQKEKLEKDGKKVPKRVLGEIKNLNNKKSFSRKNR